MNQEIESILPVNPQDVFVEEAPVLIRYPLPDADPQDYSTWSWLPGTILGQCGPDEWRVVVEAPALAEPDPSVPNGEDPENLLYPVCFRGPSELRAISEEQWHQTYEELSRG